MTADSVPAPMVQGDEYDCTCGHARHAHDRHGKCTVGQRFAAMPVCPCDSFVPGIPIEVHRRTPAPMVQLPAETVDKLREAVANYRTATVARFQMGQTADPMTEIELAAGALVDAATPAASVPVTEAAVNAGADAIAEAWSSDEDYPAPSAADLARAALVAAAEQADKGEAATPRDEYDAHLGTTIAPAAPPEPLCRCIVHELSNVIDTGLCEVHQVSALEPRVPVNDEAEAEMAWLGWEEGEKGPTTWARLHAAFIAGFRAARQGGNSDD